MIKIKNKKGIEMMREANRIIGLLLKEIEKKIIPGVSTYELDKFAEKLIRDEGALPAFKGYSVPGLEPFPGTLCTSVNKYIVHGIPSKKEILKEGDIIGIDVGSYKNGYYGDGARTFRVGEVSQEANQLIEITKQSFYEGLKFAKPGFRVGDISHAIGSFVRKNGYFVADNLTGHGIGTELHEDPMIPNDGVAGRGPRLKKGMTIAIEPMVNIGTNRTQEDGWRVWVLDNTLSSHYENTILITDNEPEILTKV